MRRGSPVPLLIIPVVVLLLGGVGVMFVGGSEPPDPLDTGGGLAIDAGDVELVSGESAVAAQPLALPAPGANPPATPTETTPPDTAPAETTPPESDEGSGGGNGGGHDHGDHHHGDDLADPTQTHGYEVHAFTDHVTSTLGAQMLAPGQQPAAGYAWLDDRTVVAHAPITGLRPVIQQAIHDVKERRPDAEGQELESRIAKRLTELNDWDNLNKGTRWDMMILSGVDIRSLDHDVREDHVNHLLHSPLSFGTIEEVLTPDVTVDMGYTHTLDKKWTQVADLGNGVFQIWMISNNNNGSHTGHVLGSFKVQLDPGTSLEDARRAGNRMVRNDNNNDRLYLDEAAKAILYGQTPWLDYSNLSRDEAKAMFEGRGLPENPGAGHDHGMGEATTTTTAPAAPATEESTTTTAAPTTEGDGTTTTTAAPTDEG